MTKINDGGAAFPLHPGILPDWDQSNGMTLRDYFAGQALAGDFASQNDEVGNLPNDMSQSGIEGRVSLFYRFADAMLAERERGQ